MTPDRWRQIEDLYRAAQKCHPNERAALLECTDPEIRSRVERMLAVESGSEILDQSNDGIPADPTKTVVASGAQLGPYKIEAQIGAGGMGTVYRAVDTRLGRVVAIKIAAGRYSERFQLEAQAISTLNHPHVCTLHDVGPNYLVMEFIEGATLAAEIKKGPLALELVARYGAQIASALAEAHARGIVHRDLKPSNVMVTRHGVKVLDFGLAKTTAEGNAPSEIGITETGAVMGTPAYMAPEQAEGRPPASVADLFSLGLVLYEMAVGKLLFPGASLGQMLASGSHAAVPAPSRGRAGVPASLDALVAKLLEKDPAKRPQSAACVARELSTLADRLAAPPSRVRPLLRPVFAVPAVLFFLVLATAGIWLYRRSHQPIAEQSAAPKPPVELTEKRLTFNSSESPVESGHISPDGKYLAYSDPAGIHVKLLSTGEDRLIPRPAGVPDSAHWSVDSWFPDGTLLLADAWELGGHKDMWTVSVLGQSARHLRDDALGFEVSPDGTHIAFTPAETSDLMREIWVMGSQGDNPQKVFTIGESDSVSWVAVHWSPDEQRLAYLKIHRNSDTFQYSIETCDLKGASRTVVVASDLPVNDFCWLPDRRIVYTRQDPLNLSDFNLWQIGIDNHAGTPTGTPKRITQFGSGFWGINASADGKRLSLLKHTYQNQVYLAELAAGGTRMSPPRRLTHNETSDYPTGWTADSKAVLFLSDRNGTMGIYKQGISQETAEPVFTGTGDVLRFGADLSADGAWILFAKTPADSPRPASASRLMRIPAGGGVPQLVLEARNFKDFACARAPASLCVFVETSQDGKQSTITAFDPLKGRGRVLRTIGDLSFYDTDLSPDGSTFAISRSNRTEIHIRLLALSGGSGREISVKGWPNITGLNWSTDGKGLYCGSYSPHGSTLLYVDLQGNVRPLWQQKDGGSDIWGVPSADGRYLAISAGVNNSNVWMLEGF